MTSTKRQLIDALDVLEDISNELPIGTATMIGMHFDPLRRMIHNSTGEDEDDPRLKPLPECRYCGDRFAPGAHKPMSCAREMLKRLLAKEQA